MVIEPTKFTNPAIEIMKNLEYTRSSLYELLKELQEEDLNNSSKNPGWTNNEILAHMLFGFIIVNVLLPPVRILGQLPKELTKPFSWLLNSLTRPFNWINKLGVRVQGKVFTGKHLEITFDNVINSILGKVKKINLNEWQNGMYYPNKWDSNFDEFMTLENY